MKKIILFLLAVPALMLASSCDQVDGRGPVTSATRSVTGFKAVAATMSADVEITLGSTYSVRIEAQRNLMDLIETVVEGDQLVIKSKDGTSFNSDKDILVHITMPELTSVDVTGSGNVKILNDVNGKSLHLDVSGSGDLETAAIHTEALDASLTGSGNMRIAGGAVQEGRFSITGNGDADADDLVVKQMTADVTGSGNVNVNVTEYLKVNVTGSGDVNYKGTAQVSAQVTGSGNVHKAT